jgi:hypothetical protein
MQIVIKADLIFFVPMLLKTFWFSFIITDFSLTDFQFFTPLSLLSIFDVSLIDKWLIYPLQTFNVFEVIFWFLLGYQLKSVLRKNFSESFKLIITSYGSGLIIWVVFVVFFVVTVS